jgi:hypothetical protein
VGVGFSAPLRDAGKVDDPKIHIQNLRSVRCRSRHAKSANIGVIISIATKKVCQDRENRCHLDHPVSLLFSVYRILSFVYSIISFWRASRALSCGWGIKFFLLLTHAHKQTDFRPEMNNKIQYLI